MRQIIGLTVGVLISYSLCHAQQDTLIYDIATGNYLIKYYPEDDFGNKSDTAITVVFEPATKIEPEAVCSVEPGENPWTFRYSYRIANGNSSRQNLIRFTLEFGKGIVIVDNTPKDGWHSLRENEIARDQLVPGHAWSWYGDVGLKPGRSWRVGALESNGLPGIVNGYFQGKTKKTVLSFPDEGPGFNLRVKLLQLRTFPSNRVIRKTIAPVPPPEPFMVLAFLDTLISYKHQAFNLGWITNKGILNSLDQKLDNARKQLERGNNKAAKNILEAFINEVEAQKEKHLSSEAYALLKFNAEYLISKLE